MVHRHRGFTLIELLVVIAIIAILAAMLFPVFARARESARKIQCLSNMKNIAMAFQLYLVDYDRFPPKEHNAEAQAYFDAGPGGGGASSNCNRAYRGNPYLRWQVILDEYTKNRDVWRCPSARRAIGASFIVPDYGEGWLRYLQQTEGQWGAAYDTRGEVTTGGPCMYSWPSGWGGAITDSIKQQQVAWPDDSNTRKATGGVETTIAVISGEYIAGDMKLSRVPDPSWFMVCGEGSLFHYIVDVNSLLYSLCRTITQFGCNNADWANCSWSRECGLAGDMGERWETDASFRNQYTRHLGGANIGFADGHAQWFPADQVKALAPYCGYDPATGGCCATVTNDRPLLGMCPPTL